MQQLPTFNFGLTKNFFFIYRTLSMRQKTKNYRIRGSNAQKNFFLFYFPSHIPIWVWFVQKTRAKNSHAWAPLRSSRPQEIFQPPREGFFSVHAQLQLLGNIFQLSVLSTAVNVQNKN
jgi:hypothetical protein